MWAFFQWACSLQSTAGLMQVASPTCLQLLPPGLAFCTWRLWPHVDHSCARSVVLQGQLMPLLAMTVALVSLQVAAQSRLFTLEVAGDASRSMFFWQACTINHCSKCRPLCSASPSVQALCVMRLAQ